MFWKTRFELRSGFSLVSALSDICPTLNHFTAGSVIVNIPLRHMKKNYKHTCRYDETTNSFRLSFIAEVNKRLKGPLTDSAIMRALYRVISKHPTMRQSLIKKLVSHFDD
jgi:hypothetical protein